MYKTNVQPLNTIDGETLLSIPMEPLNFVVDSLISQGLHILAGAPKVGKSWLALWLATTIAKGEPVWNLQTKQGVSVRRATFWKKVWSSSSSSSSKSIPTPC